MVPWLKIQNGESDDFVIVVELHKIDAICKFHCLNSQQENRKLEELVESDAYLAAGNDNLKDKTQLKKTS